MGERGDILVAGGGIGGLITALALADVGCDVHVLERGPTFATAGAGIQIGPNGVKVLRRYGVADLLAQAACQPRMLVAHSGASGAYLMKMPLGATIAQRCGAPYWTAHRADLLQALADAVARSPRIKVTFDREVVDARAGTTGGVTAQLASGEVIDGAALIGADGLWSRIRTAVAPEAKPKSSGYCAYRAVVPCEAAGLLDADVVAAWLSPNAHVIHYPVQAGRSLNIVVIVDAPWTAASWNAVAETQQVIDATRQFAPRLRESITAAPQWHKWSLPEPLSLRSWGKGPITLLGDAAHATLPFFAQGAVMALEDAVVLSRAVAAHRDDYSKAFATYHAARKARVARVQQASVGNGHIFHMSGAVGLVRDAVMKFMPANAMLARFDWLYAYDLPEPA